MGVDSRAKAYSAVILALMALACHDGASDHTTTAQFDTLADRVEVTNAGVSTWTPETAWRLEEDLRLGTVESGDPEEFGRIMSVVSDSRGMIYVLDLFYQHIQVFHPTGAFSHTIGGEGLGPGELSAARAMAVGPEDTLWVVDDGAVRYSAYAPDGTFHESHPRRIAGFFSSAIPAFLSDGRYVDWGIAFPDGRMGPRLVIWPIQFGTGFEGPDSLPPLQHTSKMLPSGRMPELYFSGGLSIAIDRRGNIWFAHTQEYRIYRRSLEGDTTLVFSLPADAARLGEAEHEYVRTTFARSPDLLSEYLRALPGTKPIVHRIVPDNAGHIFVFVDVAGVPAGTAVDVFRENGQYMGRITLPTAVPLFPSSPVVHATPEHLFVVVEDELDVLYVSRLKIVKGR